MSISIAAYESMIEKLVDCQSALAAERARAETLKQQAEIWAQEARTQKSTVHEIYQLCTGGKGEPGDWHGAEPVRAVIADRDRLRGHEGRALPACRGRRHNAGCRVIPPFARYVAIAASLRWEPVDKPDSPPPGLPQLGTYCRHGHEWTPENTSIGKDGKRDCRTCARQRARDTYWRKRQSAA